MKVLLVVAILFSSSFVYAQTSTSKQQLIVKMMELAGTKAVLDNMKVTLKETYRKAYSDTDQQFWDDFFSELSAEGLINMIVPIYDKNFSEEDIKGLIAFYESPIGKKLTQKLPMIMQESMAAGQQWGMEIGQKVQAKMQERKK